MFKDKKNRKLYQTSPAKNIFNKQSMRQRSLREQFYNLNQQLEVRFLISARHAGGVIGKNGTYINHIRTLCDVDFHIFPACSDNIPVYADGSKSPLTTPVRTGSCRGEVDNIVAALLLCSDKITELSRNHIRRPSPNGTCFQYGNYMFTLLIEHKNCGVLIGRRGVRINLNRQHSGAHIKISTHALENSTEKTVEVQGSREQIHKALETLIVQLANDPKPNITQRKYLDESVSRKKGTRKPYADSQPYSRKVCSMNTQTLPRAYAQFSYVYPHQIYSAAYHSVSPPVQASSYVIPPTSQQFQAVPAAMSQQHQGISQNGLTHSSCSQENVNAANHPLDIIA